MIEIGQKAPEFTLKGDAGRKVSLSDFKGQTVVLYFYPKDNTPGCTQEACDFRDESDHFKTKKAVVLGVSADSVDSHIKFKRKFGLPFHLLSDPDRAVIKAYEVWKEKNMYGKMVMGIQRSTFIISPEGKIQHVFNKVKVDGHIKNILTQLN